MLAANPLQEEAVVVPVAVAVEVQVPPEQEAKEIAVAVDSVTRAKKKNPPVEVAAAQDPLVVLVTLVKPVMAVMGAHHP